MNEEERLMLNNYIKELYQAIQIGDIIFKPKHSNELYNLINKLLQENKNLKKQLKQKEDIINKANNYVIDNANIYLNFIGNKVGFFKENDGKTPIELLEILDNKGE